MRNLFLLIILIFPVAGIDSQTFTQEKKTVIKDKTAVKKLLGRHLFSLQWISWVTFGEAEITDYRGTLKINAIQRGKENDDYILLQGIISEVENRAFTFDGVIVTKISHINNGAPCGRQGIMTFAIPAGKRYWRLREMQNPYDEAVDYIDIFMK